MRWFWRPKRATDLADRVKAASLLEGLETLQEIWDIVQQHIKDMGIINTAINRLERKQNRWLELLNKGDGPAENISTPDNLEQKPPVLLTPNLPMPKGEAVGEEQENFIPVV